MPRRLDAYQIKDGRKLFGDFFLFSPSLDNVDVRKYQIGTFLENIDKFLSILEKLTPMTIQSFLEKISKKSLADKASSVIKENGHKINKALVLCLQLINIHCDLEQTYITHSNHKSYTRKRDCLFGCIGDLFDHNKDRALLWEPEKKKGYYYQHFKQFQSNVECLLTTLPSKDAWDIIHLALNLYFRAYLFPKNVERSQALKYPGRVSEWTEGDYQPAPYVQVSHDCDVFFELQRKKNPKTFEKFFDHLLSEGAKEAFNRSNEFVEGVALTPPPSPVSSRSSSPHSNTNRNPSHSFDSNNSSNNSTSVILSSFANNSHNPSRKKVTVPRKESNISHIPVATLVAEPSITVGQPSSKTSNNSFLSSIFSRTPKNTTPLPSAPPLELELEYANTGTKRR